MKEGGAIMSDYIEIAPYVRNTNFIYESTLITEFVQICEIIDIKQIDIEFLRNYYRDNKEKCINLIDELALRGFTFHTERFTNMLPSMVYEIDNSCIFVQDKGERFKEINFSRLGLANFVERFNVKTDYFFKYIKLDNFLHINGVISLEILKEEFLKCGFNFVNKEELILENIDEECEDNNIDDDNDSEAEWEFSSVKERMFLFLSETAKRSSPNGVTIDHIYHKNIFNVFRSFCDLNNVTYMEQLEGMPFDDLIFFRGFGKERVKMVAKKYNEYVEYGAEQMNFGIEYTKESMQEFFEKLKLNPLSSGISIGNVFSENRFNLFRRFCEENRLIYAKHLETFPFNGLTTLRGFGQSRVNNIMERYDDFVIGKFTPVAGLETSQDLSGIGIDSYYLDIEVDVLKSIDIDECLIEEFKNRDLRLIADLLKFKYSELNQIKNVGKTKINRFVTNIKLLNQPPEELIKLVLETIKENDNFEIFRARSTGKVTLQRLGEQYNVTRECIRKREQKILLLFESFFILFKKLIFGKGDKLILDIDDIKSTFTDDEDMLYIKYALISETYPGAVYFKELDKFLLNQNVDVTRGKLDRIIEDSLEDIFDFYNEIVNIDEILKETNLEFVDIEDFLVYMKGKGFKENGNYIVRSGTSLRKIYSYILREYFPEGVRYSDQKDMEAVLKIAREDFNLERHTEEDTRSLAAMISENVLCDRGRYIHANYIDIPSTLVDKIKNYIIGNPEETLLLGDVFYRFEEELKEQSNVNNRYFLHGVLKHYYGEELIFARDKVSKASCEIMSTNKILENFLMDQGVPVEKERIREQFPGWTEVMIVNSEVVNKNIISWGNGGLTCAKLIEITETDKKEFHNAIEAELEELNGYCTAMLIYKKLQLKMNSFYKKNRIKNYVNLFYVLEHLFEDIYYFRMPHILKEKQDKQFTTIDIIIKTIEDRKVVTYDEISDYFINKLKMNDNIMYAANIKLMKRLIEVRKGEYILKDTLKLNGDSLNKIREFIEIQLSGNEYVPMISIIDYRGLPDIGYEWNPFLLQDIIEDNMPEYRFIEKHFKDRRYRCSSILRNSSELTSIVDLIVYVLNYEYNDKEKMTIQAIQQYLSLKNIIMNSLPHEFMDSEKVRIDEFHRVEIM